MHTAALERNFSNAEKEITNNKVKVCKLVFFPRQQRLEATLSTVVERKRRRRAKK